MLIRNILNNLTTMFENRFWRLSIKMSLIFLIGITAVGCEKESVDIENPPSPVDEYYVKYEVNSSTIYIGGKLDMTIKTENNKELTLTINQRTLHETIIGPVPKGFHSTMKVSTVSNTHNKLKLYTKIYVSKNGSPFALKNSNGSDIPRDGVWLDYTINAIYSYSNSKKNLLNIR